MTPTEFRAARESLGLTQSQLAAILGYGAKSRIAEIEARDTVPGPVAVAMRAMLAFGLPDSWPTTCAA